MWWRVLSAVVIVVGAGILVIALPLAAIMLMARLDSSDEIDMAIHFDVILSIAIAAGVFLIGVPLLERKTAKRLALLVLASVLAGGFIGGGLVWSHQEQVRIRSTLN